MNQPVDEKTGHELSNTALMMWWQQRPFLKRAERISRLDRYLQNSVDSVSMTRLRTTLQKSSLGMINTHSDNLSIPIYLRSLMGTNSNWVRVSIVVKTLEKVDTSTLNQEYIKTLPFWTWRVCIQPPSKYWISSVRTPEISQISNEQEWQLSVRNTKLPEYAVW